MLLERTAPLNLASCLLLSFYFRRPFFFTSGAPLPRLCPPKTLFQAEAVRARVPDRRLFYCALDHSGAQDDPCPQGRSLPHISHWGFQRALFGKADGGGGSSLDDDGAAAGARVVGAVDGTTGETVGDAVERQERTACFARSSLAFLQYGGGGGVERGVIA